MSRLRIPLCLFILALLSTTAASNVSAQQSPAVKTIVITPAAAQAEVGQELKLTAIGKDEAGKPVDMKPAAWFAAPFDIASADQSGTITFYHPGEVMVGVVIGGKVETLTLKDRTHKTANHLLGSPDDTTGAALLEFLKRTAK